MTAFALISGALFRAPDLKTSKAGKPYITATLKVAAGNSVDFWTIMGFDETVQTELMRLDEGDKISVQGSLKIEPYAARDGQVRISRTVFADHVLAVRQPPREKKPKPAPERQAAPTVSSKPVAPDFDDGLPEQWGPR